MIKNSELGSNAPSLEATVKVTPAMAKAGAILLAERYDQIGDGIDEAIAAEVFEKMLSVQLSES